MIKVNSNISNEMKSSGLKPFHLEKKNIPSKLVVILVLKNMKKNIQKYLKLFTQCRCFFDLRYKHMQNVKYSKYNKLFF